MQGIIRHAVALAAIAFVGGAGASVVMNGTRYIYPAGAEEITVKVSNVGKVPALTQAWIDDGDAKATPETVDVPFNLTPPISRVESGKSQTLRVSWSGRELPVDRESLFWLNVLEVPPKPADADTNKIQLAIRYRLKLFFRPKGLKGEADAAPAALRWARAPDGTLSVSNPSAYHVSFNDVKIAGTGGDVPLDPFSIAPGVTVKPVAHQPLPGGALTVDYQYINDFGGFVKGAAAVGAP